MRTYTREVEDPIYPITQTERVVNEIERWAVLGRRLIAAVTQSRGFYGRCLSGDGGGLS